MTSTRQRIATAYKNGKPIHTLKTSDDTAPLFQFDTLFDAGWIRIQCYGGENIYFLWTDDNGHEQNGYCKCL